MLRIMRAGRVSSFAVLVGLLLRGALSSIDEGDLPKAKFLPRIDYATLRLNDSYFAPASHIAAAANSDELLLLYALVQSSHVARMLVVGNHSRFSDTLTAAVHAKPHSQLHTVQLSTSELALVQHDEPLDLVLFSPTRDLRGMRATMERLLSARLVAHDAYVVLWGTGLDERAAREQTANVYACLLYTSPSPRDGLLSRMPSSA